jgi:NAD(P)-dependent dehydrogenase (short-subunit alcohol dehydrogenase family)
VLVENSDCPPGSRAILFSFGEVQRSVLVKKAMVWGAGGGIGTALVKALMEAGWTVVGVTRDSSSLTYSPSHFVEADVADETAVRQAVKQVADRAQGTDLWIYAVGDIESAKVDEISFGDWRRILDANLTGAYLAVHHSLPLLAPEAHIVLLGAVSERVRLPGLSAYAAAKAGIEAFADVLRKEQRRRRVTLVRPHAVDTSIWDKVPFNVPRGALRPEDVADRMLAAYQEGHRGVLNL